MATQIIANSKSRRKNLEAKGFSFTENGKNLIVNCSDEQAKIFNHDFIRKYAYK